MVKCSRMSRPKAETSRSCFPVELPLHLVEEEILSRLPAKSLLKFRSVCRSWCAFIDTPLFINLHYQNSKTKPPLFITTSHITPIGVVKLGSGWHPCSSYSCCRHRHEQKSANEEEELLIPDLPEADLDDVTLESTSNGLLLYSALCNSWVFHLVNPATKQRIQLPSFSDYIYHIFSIKILFDTYFDAYKVLMGYRTERLDIDEAFDPHSLPHTQILIFTVGVDTVWRKLACPIKRLHSYDIIREYEVINGAIHINHDNFRIRVDEEYIECILAFNIKEESFRIIEHPNCCSPNMKTRSNCNKIERSYFSGHHAIHVVGIDGLLYLIHVDVYRTIMDVWLLEDYHNGLWIKKSSFTLSFVHKKLGFAFEDLGEAFDVEPCAVIHGQLMLKVSSKSNWLSLHHPMVRSKIGKTFRYGYYQRHSCLSETLSLHPWNLCGELSPHTLISIVSATAA